MKTAVFSNERYVTSPYDKNDSRIQTLLKLVGNSGHVLDLGCLDGTIGAELMKQGNTVHGIDASQRSADLCYEKGFPCDVADLELPLTFIPSSLYDTVLAGEIIEHIYNVDQFLDECFRVLKQDGHLVLSTPNLAAFGRRLMLLLGMNPHIEVTLKITPEYIPGGHIRYFVKSSLFGLLKDHKFEVVEFTSDVINLNSTGSLKLEKLAKLFPTFGRSLIVRAKKHST